MAGWAMIDRDRVPDGGKYRLGVTTPGGVSYGMAREEPHLPFKMVSKDSEEYKKTEVDFDEILQGVADLIEESPKLGLSLGGAVINIEIVSIPDPSLHRGRWDDAIDRTKAKRKGE